MLTTTRREWGARPAKHALSPMPRTVKGIKYHYTGGFVSALTLKPEEHDECLKLIRAFQDLHMDTNGWTDFAYNYSVCTHEVIIGRGLHVMSAANGNQTLNKGHYAVLLLVGSKEEQNDKPGVIKPNDAMLNNALDIADYIRRNGPAGNELKGHKDGYATDCPGTAISAWIRQGCPRPPRKVVR